jgi:hypothetical protein
MADAKQIGSCGVRLPTLTTGYPQTDQQSGVEFGEGHSPAGIRQVTLSPKPVTMMPAADAIHR